MAELTILYRDIRKTVPLRRGLSVMETLRVSGVPIEGACAGNGTCRRCRVDLLRGRLVDENGGKLAPVEDDPGVYLACRAYAKRDVTVSVPEIVVSKGKELSGCPEQILSVDPVLQMHRIQVAKPEIGRSYSYQEATLRALSPNVVITSPAILSGLPDLLSSGNTRLRAFVHRNALVSVEPDGEGGFFGLALDIGTTTIAAIIADLTTGAIRSRGSIANPQILYGADVISRINAASTAEGVSRLHTAVIQAVNSLVARICREVGVDPADIYLVAVAGNTTMNHLFAGLSPATLSRAPFVPLFKHIPPLDAAGLGLLVNRAARVEMLPNIGGFVGADTVAAVLATGQDQSEALCLLIDLGTNGEIVLGNKEGLIAASTAAGPAFEAVHISHGSRAVRGAIDRVYVHGTDIVVGTIENGPPKGICGSGLVDAVAALVCTGAVEPSGRLRKPEQLCSLGSPFAGRIRDTDSGREVVLVAAGERGARRDIVISQNDIRELQLAKSAVATGIGVLMKEKGVSAREIEQIYLAGAFGNAMSRDSVVQIGLVPGIEPANIRTVGNAAGFGALMALLSRDELERASHIVKITRHCDLATSGEFDQEFIRRLDFPALKNGLGSLDGLLPSR